VTRSGRALAEFTWEDAVGPCPWCRRERQKAQRCAGLMPDLKYLVGVASATNGLAAKT
jgi:hypothetical protein